MRVLSPEDFRKCPPGTIFAYGAEWDFDTMLVLEDFIEGKGYWGFWAINPMWVDADDSGQAVDRLVEMSKDGVSYPAETGYSKYMSYDGDTMDWFIVFERDDWMRFKASVDRAYQLNKMEGLD